MAAEWERSLVSENEMRLKKQMYKLHLKEK